MQSEFSVVRDDVTVCSLGEGGGLLWRSNLRAYLYVTLGLIWLGTRGNR